MATAVQSGVSEPRQVHYGRLVFVLGLALGLLMVFVGWRAQSFVDNHPDPYRFSQLGMTLAEGRGFEGAGVVLGRRAPLYPLMIGGVYRLFGPHPLAVQLVQCLMLAGLCLLVCDIGSRLCNPRTGLIAGILCAVHPGLLRYVADFHLELQLAFLFTLAIWASVRFYQQPSLAWGAMFGLAVGLAALTKAVVVLYPLVFALAWLWGRFRMRKETPQTTLALPALAMVFVLMGCVILPWTYRNYQATGGKIVLISTGLNDAMLRGFIFTKPEYATLRLPPYTYAENETNAWFRSIFQQRGTEWERDDLETERILGEVAKAKLKAEPWGFVRKFVVGLFTFWYEMTSLKNSLIAGGLAAIAWGLAWIGWRRARQEQRALWLTLLPPLYLNVLLAALLALGRYSVPVLPSLMVAAAFGLDTLFKVRKSS